METPGILTEGETRLRIDVGTVFQKHLDDRLQTPRATEVERRGEVVSLLASPPASPLAPRTVKVASRPDIKIEIELFNSQLATQSFLSEIENEGKSLN